MIEKFIKYWKDNPEGYWFKAKIYGWGWTPVKWQGWLVVFVAVAIGLLGFHVADVDDAPGAGLLGFVLMLVIIFTFGFWKGEKLRWRWGFPKEEK